MNAIVVVFSDERTHTHARTVSSMVNSILEPGPAAAAAAGGGAVAADGDPAPPAVAEGDAAVAPPKAGQPATAPSIFIDENKKVWTRLLCCCCAVASCTKPTRSGDS